MTQRNCRNYSPLSSARGLLIGLLATGYSYAFTPLAYGNSYATKAVDGLPEPGAALSSISGIEEISSVRVIDPLSLSFQVNKANRYLVRLAPACPQLAFAENIVLSHAAGTLHAGFDMIHADGQQCRINEIYRL